MRRSFQLVTNVWGDQHVDLFLKLTLPNVMSAGNLPALARRGDVTYRFFTTPSARRMIEGSALWPRLKSLVTVDFQTPLGEGPIGHVWHVHWFHRAAAEAAASGHVVMFVPPDTMWSDGSLGYMADRILAGSRGVACPFLHVVSETAVADAVSRFSDEGSTSLTLRPDAFWPFVDTHLHPLQRLAMPGSPHGRPAFELHWPVGDNGLVSRYAFRELCAFDPARCPITFFWYAAGPDMEGIDFPERVDQAFMLSVDPLSKYMQNYVINHRTSPVDLAHQSLHPLNDTGSLNFFIGRHVQAYAREAGGTARRLAFLRAEAAARDVRVARAAMLVARSLEAAGCHTMAGLLSVALFESHLSRRWRILPPITLVIPSDDALAREGMHDVLSLIEPGRERELVAALRDHVVPHDLLVKPRGTSLGGTDLVLNGTPGDGMTVNGCNVLHGPTEVEGIHILVVNGVPSATLGARGDGGRRGSITTDAKEGPRRIDPDAAWVVAAGSGRGWSRRGTEIEDGAGSGSAPSDLVAELVDTPHAGLASADGGEKSTRILKARGADGEHYVTLGDVSVRSGPHRLDLTLRAAAGGRLRLQLIGADGAGALADYDPARDDIRVSRLGRSGGARARSEVRNDGRARVSLMVDLAAGPANIIVQILDRTGASSFEANSAGDLLLFTLVLDAVRLPDRVALTADRRPSGFGELMSARREAEPREPAGKPLGVETYDEAERCGSRTLPNRIIEACQAVTFAAVGYPVRLGATTDAARFVDVMQEGRSDATVSDVLNGLTQDDIDLMARVAEKVARLTDRLYGRRQVPRASLLRALNIVRHITYLKAPLGTTVLEIGAGSGYVGALLIELGYRYATTDVAQAFYIYQNHLLNECTSGDLIELATDPRSFMDLERTEAWTALHIPWWKFVTPDPNPALKFDIITCNHALCEMHSNALAYSTTLSRHLLKPSDDSYFIFEGWGSTIHNDIWRAGEALTLSGLVFAQNDVHVSVLTRDDTRHARDGLDLRSRPGSPDIRFHPPIYVNPRSDIGSRIADGRDDTASRATHGLPDLDATLRRIAGYDDLRTADEKFGDYVRRRMW